MSAVSPIEPQRSTSVIIRMGERYGVDAAKLLTTLKATVFKGDVSTEQLMALLVVADAMKLNPFTREIYAFPDKRNGIIPVVGVDGWCRIINEHPAFNGLGFVDGPINEQGLPEWIECTMHRKDRAYPISAREYMAECYRPPFEKDGRKIDGPWQTHPRRFLRHKSLIQTARIAFGFVGIYDPDEGERIAAATEATPADLGPRPDTSAQDPQEIDKWVGTITDVLNQDKEEVEIAAELRDINNDLSRFPEMFTAVFDALKARGVITKAKWKEYLTK